VRQEGKSEQSRCASGGQSAVDGDRPSAPLWGTETLLLVDDEKLIVDAVGRILRDYGYEVLEAHEPEYALTLLQDRAQDVRLIVTDLMMPGMSGHTLIARCRQIAPDLRAVVMSGAADDLDERCDPQNTDVCFVRKPFSAPTLLGAIRSLLDGAARQI
jgi:two-component system cell cycle sensor histidine kinase/response regulator CckA